MFERRSYQKELLDGDDIPFDDIRQNMKELERVNKLLGGHAITLKGIEYFLKYTDGLKRPIVIAELGCGGGDNLFAIHKFLRERGVAHKLIGIDIKEECLSYAISRYPDIDVEWLYCDYVDAQWPDNIKPDIVFSSLFCHHFTDEELIGQLRWIMKNAMLGFFINDLHRHAVAYYSIKWLTRIFSKSYLVKNDAPISVTRGFIKEDWKFLLQRAGIIRFKISAEWAFRYLVCVKYDQGT